MEEIKTVGDLKKELDRFNDDDRVELDLGAIWFIEYDRDDKGEFVHINGF